MQNDNFNIAIDFAKIEDVKELCEAEKLIFNHDTKASCSSFTHAINSPFENIIILRNNEELAGYLVYSTLDNTVINIDDIAVLPKFRRRHYAENMLNYLFNTVMNESIEMLWLEVREGNIAAILLYEKFEFKVNGKRPRYYRNPVEDAVLMQWER